MGRDCGKGWGEGGRGLWAEDRKDEVGRGWGERKGGAGRGDGGRESWERGGMGAAGMGKDDGNGNERWGRAVGRSFSAFQFILFKFSKTIFNI